MSRLLRSLTFFVCSVMVVLVHARSAVGQARFAPPPNLPATMQKLEGRYHTLYHELDPAEAQEVVLRMDAMTEEYAARTRAFGGRLPGKMPFVLFRNAEDYHAAGGMPGSAGVYMRGRCLMAIAGEKVTSRTWSTIQHEGFHEFADAVISPRMPIWINEGLAEYFGEAVFTGDGFVSGTIPRHRLERVQAGMRDKRFRSVDAMMALTHEAWNRGLAIENYDQAWAMTMFLAHGEDGRYQKAFARFMEGIGRGAPWQQCWADAFGNTEGFEQKWQEWWLGLPEDVPIPGYARAATQMLASYLARATAQKQAYASIDELMTAITTRQLKWHRDDVLPGSLADDCQQLHAALTKAGATFAIQTVGTGAAARATGVTCALSDGTTITATFKLNGTRVRSVESKVDAPKTPPTKDAEKRPAPLRR